MADHSSRTSHLLVESILILELLHKVSFSKVRIVVSLLSFTPTMSNKLSRGLLIKTDVPTKQLIIHLNELNDGVIVLKDLDDEHLLIRPDYRDFVLSEVEKLFNQNTYERKRTA